MLVVSPPLHEIAVSQVVHFASLSLPTFHRSLHCVAIAPSPRSRNIRAILGELAPRNRSQSMLDAQPALRVIKRDKV